MATTIGETAEKVLQRSMSARGSLEFEADLIRMRTKEGMAIALAKGKLKGKKPKLSDRQTELRRVHNTGDYVISDLAELFDGSRPSIASCSGHRVRVHFDCSIAAVCCRAYELHWTGSCLLRRSCRDGPCSIQQCIKHRAFRDFGAAALGHRVA